MAEKIENSSKAVAAFIRAASEHYNADIFLYSGEIADSGYGKLVEAVLCNKSHNSAVLILTTNGGSGNAGFSIARFLQKIYDKIYIYAPSYCKSAGTLIALGANELIMDTFSELGPLDVQLLKQNEIGTRKSGLLTRSALDALADNTFELFETLMLKVVTRSGGIVSFALASDLSAKMTSSLMSGIYSKIDPDIVGSDQRDLDVAFHYGLRLIDTSGNATASVVRHLVNHYPSHDFIIDNEEASELFERVSYPTSDLMKLSGFFGGMAYDEADDIVVIAMSELLREKDDDVERDEKGGVDEASESDNSAGIGNADRKGDSGAPVAVRHTEDSTTGDA